MIGVRFQGQARSFIRIRKSPGRRSGMPARHAAAVAFLWLVAGCTTYQPEPLPTAPNLLPAVPQSLPADVGQRWSGAYDPKDGLDIMEVGVFAAANSPMLRAARQKLPVARAQLAAAGVLADPQIGGSFDFLTSGPATVNAFSLGLSYDLQFFVTWHARIAKARAAASQVGFDVLWQEWQVIQKARSLYADAYFTVRKQAILEDARSLFAKQERRSGTLLTSGDVTLDVAATDLVSLLDADVQLRNVGRQQQTIENELDAVLGLEPGVKIDLVPLPEPAFPERNVLEALLERVATSRPDLLALRAGYRSQEEGVREAVLAQFPSINLGLTRARDTSAVYTTGLTVGLTLPIFDGNRSKIAIEHATRAQLRAEYQARLDQTRSDALQLWDQARLIVDQIKAMEAELPRLAKMVAEARTVLQGGDFPALTYATMQNTLFQKRLEVADLQLNLWQTSIAFDTVVGLPLFIAKSE